MIVTASNYQHAGSSAINPSTVSSSLSSSRASSPSFVRRDSILKRAGSVKGDQQQKKNVSIVTDLPSVEVVSERRKSSGTSDNPGDSALESNRLTIFVTGRPASLILGKNERPIFKITRSYSFDEDNAPHDPTEMLNESSPARDESQPLVK